MEMWKMEKSNKNLAHFFYLFLSPLANHMKK